MHMWTFESVPSIHIVLTLEYLLAREAGWVLAYIQGRLISHFVATALHSEMALGIILNHGERRAIRLKHFTGMCEYQI